MLDGLSQLIGTDRLSKSGNPFLMLMIAQEKKKINRKVHLK